GGAGQNGQIGGNGGNGASGIINTSGCNDNNHKGGTGGNGGKGGNGANGDTGPNGEAYKIVVVPTSGSATKTNDGYGDDLPSAVLTSIDYGISSKKGCTNSQIALTRSGGSWNGQYGTLVNDVAESSSSYSADNESIIVGYTALGSFAPTSDGRKVFITQERSIGEIDGTDEFDAGESGNYLYDESLSSGDIMYWSLVSEDGATQYSTAVSVYDGTDGNTFSVNSTVLGLTPGDYYIKLEVDNNCCGMSVPIWKSITVKEPSLLPIELTSFSAECDGKSSLVEWTTATERNNDHFVLERSDDAINFTEIARVAGAGNSIEPLDYSYTDYDIRNGDNYYRLWQVDYDGTRTASEIIVATCVNETIDAPEVLTYPNPFSGELTVVLENFGNSKARIEIIDMLGKVVKEITVDNPHNSKEVVLHLDEIPAQAYNIRIRTKDFVINKQVIKN
ncbi:MAG: T9SS type A sorting domain-containing protein, partial [Bacteroidales bacterium]|nr:T9SS type A sorting domain-containing protein [Bacteroidales bacterium]